MLKKFLNSTDFSGVVIVTIGTYIAAFFSYLLQYFLGRMLSVEDYGLFSTYLAISYILGIPAYVISTSLIKYVADCSGKNEYAKLAVMYRLFQRIVITFGLTLGVLIGLFHRGISEYLNIQSLNLTLIYALVMAFSYFITVPFAYLQGYLRYRSYSLTSVVSSFSRFAIPILFLYFGFGLPGVFAGLIGATWVSYLLSIFLLRRNLALTTNVNIRDEIKKVVVYSIPLFFINIGLIFLNNIDLIVVKKLFSPTEVGYYAGTVTLGKILLFGASTITTVMFPKIANLYSQKKPLVKPFLFFLTLQLVVVGIGTILFNIFPSLLTNIFFGQKFSGSVPYLPGFSLFIAIYVLINFMVMFMMAIGEVRIYLLLIPAVIIQYYLLHSSKNIFDVISTNTLISCILLVSLLFLSALYIKRATYNKNE